MVSISLDGETMRVEVLGWSRLWCFKRHLEVPFARVREIRNDGQLPRHFRLRAPGTSALGLMKAGSYSNGRRWSFWDIRRDLSRVLIIELSDWKYDFLVVEVAEPVVTMAMLNAALNAPPDTAAPASSF